MNRHITATLPDTATYDDCLISACLRKLFVKTPKSKAEPAYIISKSIADLKKELERVNKDDVFELSYTYLLAMEQSMPGAGFRYVVIYKEHMPVLFGYFQLFTLTSQNFSLDKDKSFVKNILAFFLDLKKVKVLISGNALRNETACFVFNKDILSKEEAAEVMASVAEKIADEEKTTAIILKDIPGSAHVSKWLKGIGYKMPWEDKVMTMPVNPKWQTLNDYIAALSRKYKTRANKILASANSIGVRELTIDEVVRYEDELYRLYKNVADNQQFVLIQPLPDHFTQLKKAYNNDFEVFSFFNNGRLVAFYSAFVTDTAYEVYYVGFDYAANNEFQLYFNILFAGLERSILLGKKQLKLGRTSFDAKASIGAKPMEMNYFIKMANIPNVVTNWFANYFSSMEDAKWKLRNPIKE